MDIKQSRTDSETKITVRPKEIQPQTNPRYIVTDGALTSIQKLVEVMMVVNTKSPEAQLNATSIPDNNGGRIQLNDPTIPKPDFTKVIPNK